MQCTHILWSLVCCALALPLVLSACPQATDFGCMLSLIPASWEMPTEEFLVASLRNGAPQRKGKGVRWPQECLYILASGCVLTG